MGHHAPRVFCCVLIYEKAQCVKIPGRNIILKNYVISLYCL